MDKRASSLSLFLVKTPLQYLNGLEAQDFFKISPDKSIIIFFTDFKQSQLQITKNLEWNNWMKIYSIFSFRNNLIFKTKGNNFLIFLARKVKALITLFIFLRRYNKFENMFIGHIEDPWMRYILKRAVSKNMIFLEDGIATLRIAEKRLKSNHNEPLPIHKQQFKSEIFNRNIFEKTILGKQAVKIDKIAFFTVYENISVKGSDQVIRNEYSRLKVLKSNNQAINDNEIWFIGQPLVDRGLLNKGDFIKALRSIKSFYGPEFRYRFIAHRSGRTPHYIVDEGFNILHFNNPVEIELVNSGNIPGIIGSISSAALINIKNIYEDQIKLFFIRFDEEFYFKSPDSKRILDYYVIDKRLVQLNYDFVRVNDVE